MPATIAQVIDGVHTPDALLYVCKGLSEATIVTSALNYGSIPDEITAKIREKSREMTGLKLGVPKDIVDKTIGQGDTVVFEDFFPPFFASVTGRAIDEQEVNDVSALMRHFAFGEPHFLTQERVLHASGLLLEAETIHRRLIENNKPQNLMTGEDHAS